MGIAGRSLARSGPEAHAVFSLDLSAGEDPISTLSHGPNALLRVVRFSEPLLLPQLPLRCPRNLVSQARSKRGAHGHHGEGRALGDILGEGFRIAA